MHEWTLRTGPRGPLLRICEWAGEGTVPTVILHGFLEQGAAWGDVATGLPGRVIAPDQRGFGRSGHLGTGGFYHFWDYVSDLDALVEHLGGQVDLVGHSMGGTVAALFAGCRPDCVRRLVLVEGLGPPDRTEGAVDRARCFLRDRRTPPIHRPMADIPQGATRIRTYNPNISEASAQRLATRTLRPTPDGQIWTWDPLHRARSPVPFQAALFKRFLAEITAPTLYLRGGTSTFVLPDEADRLGSLRHVVVRDIPGAGHLIHHDAPGRLAARIAEHLS